MAKTEITGLKNTPLINMQDTVGGTFTGVIASAPREVKTKLGSLKYAYLFKVIDGDVDFVNKTGDGKYEKVEVSEGDEVTLMATNPLHKKLQHIPVGGTAEIIYQGKERSPKTGVQFHNFKVSLVTED